jgi:hypothetical protein
MAVMPDELLLPVLELLPEESPLLLLTGQQLLQHPLVGLRQLRHDAVQVLTATFSSGNR